MIRINITDEEEQILSGKNSKDKEKGEIVELIIMRTLYELGAEQVYKYENQTDQVQKGDLLSIKDNVQFNIEAKTSHTWKGKDKQAIDIYYFKYDRKYGLLPYRQEKSTNDYRGWIYLGKADWLACFNAKSTTLYIIKSYDKLKKQLIKEVEEYINKLPKCEYSWFRRGNDNVINKYVEGSVKEDYNKQSLIINLELSEECFKHYNIDYDIIQIELKTVRRLRESEKAPNTIGRCKRSC